MKFQKGWADPELHAQFADAIADKDCTGMRNAITKQAAQRRPVDPAAGIMRSSDRGMMEPAEDRTGTEEFAKDLAFVRRVAELRDLPLAEAASALDMPDGFTKRSIFLEGTRVKNVNNKNFILTHEEWLSVSRRGDIPSVVQEFNGTTEIKTGRDFATYVHDDNPYEQWGRVVAYLLSQGVPLKTEEAVDELLPHCDSFACWGFPHIMSIVAEGIGRAGKISFTRKWRDMVPRPEEAAVMLGGEILPQCYPEGSPMHPSCNAMHSIAALTAKEILLQLFYDKYVLPSGRTVGEELGLFSDNIGYGRVWAGVHYTYDHESVKATATKLATAIVKAALR